MIGSPVAESRQRCAHHKFCGARGPAPAERNHLETARCGAARVPHRLCYQFSRSSHTTSVRLCGSATPV